ncbi:L-ascorbate metabolism protein UlaG, beta-lactamase superfamily [Flavobacteriaceae bacterium MAR_2010_188]|nr:L-ascorbate metabolism protein UlaG, beta-lactamase superfamily [Flavobacteriaceae bacterium MAR_2010_188]
MRKFILSILIFTFLWNCVDNKKKTIPNEEEIESIIEIDSISTIEIDSVSPTVIVPKATSKKPILSRPDSLTIKKPMATLPKKDEILITPINHATLVLEAMNNVIYVDPVGGKSAFEGLREPDFILVTDIHGDHFDFQTIKDVIGERTVLIGPDAVKKKLPPELLKNFVLVFNGISQGFKTSKMALDIEGIAMYNLRPEALKYHEKGRGNGYLLTLNKKRIYISGDTEDIPEMRKLKNIDIAFVCMNLPYTMTVKSAADAVLDFKPKVVYPYHHRGSDVENFKQLVESGNKKIEVKLLDWYPDSV